MAIALSVNVQGLQQTRRYFERIGRTIPRRAIPDALVEIALKVQRNAAQGLPRNALQGPQCFVTDAPIRIG